MVIVRLPQNTIAAINTACEIRGISARITVNFDIVPA